MRRNLDAHLVNGRLRVLVDLVADLRDDRHVRNAVEQRRGQPVDLGERRFASGENPEIDVDGDFRPRRLRLGLRGERDLR